MTKDITLDDISEVMENNKSFQGDQIWKDIHIHCEYYHKMLLLTSNNASKIQFFGLFYILGFQFFVTISSLSHKKIQ